MKDGIREYSIIDGREVEYNRSVAASQTPPWQWDVELGTVTWNIAPDVNNIAVMAPAGYLPTTDTATVYQTTEGQWEGWPVGTQRLPA
ncbi:MAG UNVERIFIED_CONTAM: hypothetical protein LVR18_03140 [Planctomycetaceae bacterium]